MSTSTRRGKKDVPDGVRRRRLALVLGVLALLAAGAALLYAIDDGDGFGGLGGGEGADHQYLVVFGLIAADAVVPIFPGETTLNAASALAAQGTLELWLVILAGGLGAILGDSALYWIARRGAAGRLTSWFERAKANPKVAVTLEFVGDNAPLVLVLGRYVPGLRYVVNMTMGLRMYPYPRFLLWSSIGGISWSAYTCLLAYYVASALADYPLASILISGAITTLLIGLFFVYERRRRRRVSPASGA